MSRELLLKPNITNNQASLKYYIYLYLHRYVREDDSYESLSARVRAMSGKRVIMILNRPAFL